MENFMRLKNRFTPELLDYFLKLGRGLGKFNNYAPWHQVTRIDPPSKGRSSVMFNHTIMRDIHLLSDGELVCYYFALMTPNIVDIREQFPLSQDDLINELFEYDLKQAEVLPGTVHICKSLKYKHPSINGNGRSALWVMTTDILLTFKDDQNRFSLLAISYKASFDALTKRDKQKLEIELNYWNLRNVKWQLLTNSNFHPGIALTLRKSAPWVTITPVSLFYIQFTIEKIPEFYGLQYWTFIKFLEIEFKCMNLAQGAFWQTVWSGKIMIDLRNDFRPSTIIKPISKELMMTFNPITNGSSSWI